MKREVAPINTTRAQAFELWMKAPNPMVTFFKTLDVTRLVRISRRKGLKYATGGDFAAGTSANCLAGRLQRFFDEEIDKELLSSMQILFIAWPGPHLCPTRDRSRSFPSW